MDVHVAELADGTVGRRALAPHAVELRAQTDAGSEPLAQGELKAKSVALLDERISGKGTGFLR